MFDISWSELLALAIIALIFIGPKELPVVLHSLGKWIGKLRFWSSQFQAHIREAGGDISLTEEDILGTKPTPIQKKKNDHPSERPK